MTILSQNIYNLRASLRLTQKEFAAIAGVSDKAVSAWEKGIREPRMGAIQRIADHFGLYKSDIIDIDISPKLKLGTFDLDNIAYHHEQNSRFDTLIFNHHDHMDPQEQWLITSFRKLKSENKEDVIDYVNMKLAKEKR